MDNILGDMMNHAKKIQGEMEKVLKELQNAEVLGESGAGMVKITMNGRHDVKNVEIDPDLLSEDRALLEDLIAAVVNDAVRKVESANKDKLSNVTSGISMPEGFKMPF